MTTTPSPTDADSYLNRLARHQVDEVVVALGPLYNTDRQSWSAGTLARKAAADLARGGTRTDLDPATVGALGRLIIAMNEHQAEQHALLGENLRLSLMLRAMARKLITYRRWADGDVPTARRLQGVVDRVQATVEAADIGVRMGMSTSSLRWETAQAVLDDIRAALKGDQPAEPGGNA